MDLGLSGQRILVVGASRGLGLAMAKSIAAEGARLALMARPSSSLDAAATGTKGISIAIDLANETGPAEAVRRAVEALGGLDGLVVNGGGPPAGSFADVDEAAWATAIAGTLQGPMRLIRAALPHLKAGRSPAIVWMLSSSVREPIPGLVTSNVLRPALAGLIKTLVGEIAPIRINGLAPGRFDTERVRSLDAGRASKTGTTIETVQAAMREKIPLGRYGDPDEMGRVAAFLLSPAASYVHGVILSVDGGMTRALPA